MKKIIKKLSNPEFIYTALAQVLQLISGVLVLKILTSGLSTESFGVYSLIMATSSFILTVPFTALQQGFYRFSSVYNKNGLKGDFYSSMIIGISVLILIYLIGIKTFSFLSGRELFPESFSFIFIYIVSEIFKIYTRCIINADRLRKIYATSMLFELLLRVSIYFSVIYFSIDNKINIILLTYTLANVTSIILCSYPYASIFHKVSLVQLVDIWKKIAVFSMPLLIWGGFGWLRDSSLRWFINQHIGINEVAAFSALSSMAVVIPMAVQSILSAYVIPILYENDNGIEKDLVQRKFKDLMKFVYFLGVIIFAFLLFFSDALVTILADEKYSQYSKFFPWMFLSYYIFCCSMLSATRFLVNFNTRKLLMPNLVSGVVTLLGGFFFIEQFGLQSAVVTYCLSYVLYSFLVLLLLRNE